MLAVLVVVASLHTDSINMVAGDRSAELGYGGPTEQDRIRGHLLYAHATLSTVDTTALPPSLREARAKNLDRLLAYARAGQFPRNDGHPDARRPTFVDGDGDICAVGALYASDRGFAEAARISRDFKYAFIPQIVDADLHAWQRTSGLTPDELALIQPAYGWEDREYRPPTYHLWDAFGLTDRMLLGPSRISLTQEVSFATDTTTSTLYGHAAVGKRTSMYLSASIGFRIEQDDDTLAAAGGSVAMDLPRHWYGNSDAGLFWGKEHDDGTAHLYRLGALLPTGTSPQGMTAMGMRAGDVVQQLPRSYGVRASRSHMVSWRESGGTGYMVRFDAGFDFARETEGEHQQRFVPRAALGFIVAKRFTTISLDTSVAHVFTDDVEGSLQWSGGATFRFGLRDGGGCGFQPALTLAAVRTPEGWGGVIAADFAMVGFFDDDGAY